MSNSLLHEEFTRIEYWVYLSIFPTFQGVSSKLLIDLISLSILIRKNKSWKRKNVSAELMYFAFQ